MSPSSCATLLACLFATTSALSPAADACEHGGDVQALLQRHGAHKSLQDYARFDADMEPNPPQWPPSVYIFSPETENISCTVQVLFTQLGPLSTGKFSSLRVAFLFKPGNYSLDVPVGFYTQVLGLGESPEEVTFTGSRGVYGPSEADNVNFNTFWKAVENVANRPTSQRTTWSVSQAAPMRRVKVHGDLAFGEPGKDGPSKGSGGFVANLEVTGTVDLVRQQQWLIRSCKVQSTTYFDSPPRAVNFVYVGTEGAPAETCCTNSMQDPVSPYPQNLLVEKPPVLLEKPYITVDAMGKFNLAIPRPVWGRSGPGWDESDLIGFEHVFVATDSMAASAINAKLAAGRHVVLSPGIYQLSEPLRLGFNESAGGQVLLGLGMATLVPTAGTAVIEVGPSCGVRVAGVLLQAGAVKSPSLLRWEPNSCQGDNPGLLADVFARVGGPNTEVVSADVMIEVGGNHVVLDNVWAWRADCCQLGCGTCVERYCKHGVVVNGANVVSYGLFSEHCREDLTVWNGEYGMSFFYQSEMDSFARQPWDHTPDYGENGVSGYRVNARNHTAVGIGVYAYFVEPGNVVKAGTVIVDEATSKLTCPFAWNLNPAWYNNSESGIERAVRIEHAHVLEF